MSIYKQLNELQQNLHAPKGQKNTFGNYKYRSAEDILEASKKAMPEGCVIVLSDNIIMIGDRYYIETTASFINEKGEKVENKAFAREAQIKKGMDEAQITGSSSSYSRKYALNGLLCIDDTKDADTDEHRQQTSRMTATQTAEEKANKKLAQDIVKLHKTIAKNMPEEIKKEVNILFEKHKGNKKAYFEAINTLVAQYDMEQKEQQ